MDTWAVPKRAFMGALWSCGLGFLGGALEMVTLAAGGSLSVSLGGFLLLGSVALVLMGLVGFLIGLLTGPLQLLFARARPSTALAVQLTASGFLLCGYYLWQAAWGIHLDERTPAALAMAAMPLGFTGVIYFNARFFLRRLEIGKPLGLPWLPGAFGAALGIVAVAGAFQAFRDTGGTFALEDDRNVVFLLVSEASSFGQPVLDALGPEAVPFTEAVSPDPALRPAAAVLLTALHPLRNRVLFEEDLLTTPPCPRPSPRRATPPPPSSPAASSPPPVAWSRASGSTTTTSAPGSPACSA